MIGTPKANATPIPAWATAESATSRAPTSRAQDLGGHAYLTVAEAACLLRVSEKTIRRLIACGDLPVCRVGRSVRISAKILAALTYYGSSEV
jgi:excisionase family DNA binding protein